KILQLPASLHQMSGPKPNEISEEQRVEFKLMFDSFVKNEERTVLPEDLEMMMRKLGFHPSKMEIQGMIEEIDTDGSVTINGMSYEQFELLAARKAHDDISSEDITDAFRVFDRDANGFISAAEIRNVAHPGETYTDEEIDALLQAAKPDMDGNINYEDFVQRMME
uniref:Calmodulin n=1 Tax=Macrostomum lignano TaxID=282301 RepID=A0A1I8GEN8_9PLAT